MALESLAPDQRAVVQLVLQQGRSYADLARLLGISDEAVAQRARAGLATLAGDSPLSTEEQAGLADFVLGQLKDTERTTTEGLLASSAPARAWAETVMEELRPVARHGLPELPAAADVVEVEAEPEAAPEAEAEPAPEVEAEPEPVAEAEPEAEPAPRARPRKRGEPAPDAAAGKRPRDRTRPARRRPARDKPKAEAAAKAAPWPEKPTKRPKAPAGAPTPSSRIGGAILIVLMSVLLVAAVLYVINRNAGEEPAAPPETTTQPAQTTPEAQQGVQLPLKPDSGSKGEGLVQVSPTAEGQVGFTLVARNVEPNVETNAYAVWLIGKGRPARRLGFTRVNEDRTLATSGPEEKTDPAQFTRWLTQYSQMVVSRETSDKVREPTTVILRADLSPLREDPAAGSGGAGEQGAGEDETAP